MAGKHRVRSVDYTKVLELYYEGKTDQEIADHCGCVRATIGEWRRRQKLPANIAEREDRKKRAKKQNDLTPLEQDAIAAREAGMTYGQYKAQQYIEQQKRDLQLSALRKNGGKK